MALSSHIVFRNHHALESAAPAHKNLSLPKAVVDDLENGDGNGGYFSCSRLGLSGPGDNGALLNGAGLLEPIGVDAIEQLIGDIHVVDVFSPSVIFGQSFAVAFPSGFLSGNCGCFRQFFN